jgi:hypothetical protein
MVLVLALPFLSSPTPAGQWNVTVVPNASIHYKAEGKALPQGYATHVEGMTSPLYRLEFRESPADGGYWSLALTHTGVFGGGGFASERVPDAAGADFQTDRINVGFVDAQLIRRRPLAGGSVEGLIAGSVRRGYVTRKNFIVQGRDAGLFDHRQEIGVEGLGLGLAGRHGAGRITVRWQTLLTQYIQLADAKTDASFGQSAEWEGGLGFRLSPRTRLELGGFRNYWYVPGPAVRAAVPGGGEAIVAWQRQRMTASGVSLRWETDFGR